VRFNFLMAAHMKMAAFSFVAPYTQVQFYVRVRSAYRPAVTDSKNF
jgi:hypothetical protein